MTPVLRPWPVAGVVILVAALLGACGGPGTSPQQADGSPRATLPPTSAPASTEVVATPASTAAAATVSPPSHAPGPPIPAPPAASIAVEGGDPVEGTLGTYTWRNGGSDAPWLDGAPIHVGAGEQLAVTLARPVAIEQWTAVRTTPGNGDGFGSIGLAEGTGGLPRFAPPPIGTWSVQVNVWFAGGQGMAAYYWLIEVD